MASVGETATVLHHLMLALLLGIVSAEQQCDSAGYPRIVIGCWQLLEREHDQSQAVATLKGYVDAGYTAFDTADIYGPSEAILGKLRKAVSVPLRFFTKYVTKDASVHEARRVNANSRAALGAVPEIVQLHWWDYADGRFVEAARHLVTLQHEGLLTDVAACNFDLPHLRRLVDAGVPLVANQATPCSPGCNSMQPRLQPHATQAAAPCNPDRAHTQPSLRRHANQAAIPCMPGCNRMSPRLQPCVNRA